MQHLVYFIKAKRYPWVKVGMSRDMKTMDKRLTTIASREPFDVVLMGVSSRLEEKDAHSDLSEHHVRSEWFRWNKDVSDYVKAKCDVYLRHKDGDDGWFILMSDIEAIEHNQRTLEIQKHIRDLESA